MLRSLSLLHFLFDFGNIQAKIYKLRISSSANVKIKFPETLKRHYNEIKGSVPVILRDPFG